MLKCSPVQPLVPALVFVAMVYAFSASSEVQILGQMRRMFTAHDIGPNVSLAKVNEAQHVYGLGPLAGLHGEITVLDGQIFVSRAGGKRPKVTIEPDSKAIFLVFEAVSAWRSISLPTNVSNESDLATFLEKQLPKNTRSAFRVRGVAAAARHHVLNYKGTPENLTHEAHDRAKVIYDVANEPVELVGFFTNREGDGGLFVHMGQTIHVHLITKDLKEMGHLEAIRLQPGAELLLPTASESSRRP